MLVSLQLETLLGSDIVQCLRLKLHFEQLSLSITFFYEAYVFVREIASKFVLVKYCKISIFFFQLMNDRDDKTAFFCYSSTSISSL